MSECDELIHALQDFLKMQYIYMQFRIYGQSPSKEQQAWLFSKFSQIDATDKDVDHAIDGYDIKDATHGHTYYKSETIACADADDYDTNNPLVFDSTVMGR